MSQSMYLSMYHWVFLSYEVNVWTPCFRIFDFNICLRVSFPLNVKLKQPLLLHQPLVKQLILPPFLKWWGSQTVQLCLVVCETHTVCDAGIGLPEGSECIFSSNIHSQMGPGNGEIVKWSDDIWELYAFLFLPRFKPVCLSTVIDFDVIVCIVYPVLYFSVALFMDYESFNILATLIF